MIRIVRVSGALTDKFRLTLRMARACECTDNTSRGMCGGQDRDDQLCLIAGPHAEVRITGCGPGQPSREGCLAETGLADRPLSRIESVGNLRPSLTPLSLAEGPI